MAAPITRNLTILLTDIKGFTDKSSHKTRVEIQQMLDKHKEIVLPILEGKGGKLVKTIGDAFLMTFESPTDAVLSGVEVQEALRAYNVDKEADLRIEIRVAINQGEVNLSDNDVYGEPVNITARIEAIAEANEVFFTDAVYLAMNKKEVPSSEVGLLQLKGIPEKVRVYKVKRETPLDETARAVSGAPAGPVAAAIDAGRALGRAARVFTPAAEAAAGAVTSLPGVKMSKPTLFKRSAAVLIDACICGIIISALVPGERDEVHFRKSHRAQTETAAVPAPPQAPATPAEPADSDKLTISELARFGAACSSDLNGLCSDVKGDAIACLKKNRKALKPDCGADLDSVTKKDPKLTADKNGIHGSGIGVDDTGVHLPGVSIDRNGVRVPWFAADKNGVDIAGVHFASAQKSRDVEDDDEADAGNGWKVRTIRREKNFNWFALCWFVYALIFYKRMGTTPGGRVCKLAVVMHATGQPIDKSARLMRAAVSLVSGWCVGLGYLWALWEKDGRGWHDLMAGTRVVAAE